VAYSGDCGRRFDSCGKRVSSKSLLTGRLADHVLKGYQMELFNLQVSKWGISLETYFGDVYLYHRAWLTALGVIVVLRLAKRIREAW
jgi:hypothetical protein